MLAPELLHKVFSSLSYSEIYRIRSVCKSWKQLCEYHLYLSFKSNNQKILVKIGEKGRTGLVYLDPYRYHPDTQVIEFKALDDDAVLMDVDSSNSSSRKMQILFSEWCERSSSHSSLIQSLGLAERAQVLFHLRYNPSLEQVYEVPVPTDKHNNHERYVGDKGVIMAFSYYYYYGKESGGADTTNRAVNFRGIEDPVITSSFQTLFDEVLSNRPVVTLVNKPVARLRVRSIHVNLSWLMSGIIPDISPLPIYVERYQKLAEALRSEGVHSNICAYSEPVLKYIIQPDDDDYILSPNDITEITQWSSYSRRELLRFKLQSLGIDARSIWKYNIAKSYILNRTTTSSNGRERDRVAKIIQKSEEEWVIKKLDLIRQLRK